MTDTATELVLDDLIATRCISANRRIHHFLRAEVCAYWRKLAHDAAVDAYGWADAGQTWHHRVRVVIHVRFPDKRRRDVGNLYPYVAKPIVDGLVDARVIPDDDDHHCIGPDLRRDYDRGPLQVRIRIEDAT